MDYVKEALCVVYATCAACKLSGKYIWSLVGAIFYNSATTGVISKILAAALV